MWLIGCEFRGEPHWLGYSAWNATLYEPALDRLLMLDREDFAEEGRIDEASLSSRLGRWSATGSSGPRWPRSAARSGGAVVAVGGGKRPRQDGSK